MPSSKDSQGRFVSQRTTKKIHVAELKVGMYISKLDRDWLETPFLMQGFAVESLDDISTVADFCEYVWVDALEEHWAANNRLETIKKNPRQQILINKTSTVQENQKILGVYRDAKRITKNLMDEARFATSINTETARETVDHCVQSVLRNADALVWLSRMRDQDEYTSEHCLNVCINAIAFGRNLGMVEEELQELGLCGLLHDIGKMKIPPEILNKPDKLTPEEFNIMKRHTVYGRNLLMSGNNATPKAVDVAWNHHESLDGSGYPRGLNETGISQYARIVAIVDAYDAMTADRCYKPAMTTTEALKIIYRGKGTKFDAELVDLFIKTVGLYPPGSIVELANGEVGLVFEVNSEKRHLPKIIILRDANKEPIKERVLDLALTQTGKVGNEYLIKKVHVDGSFGVTVREYQEKGLMFKATDKHW